MKIMAAVWPLAALFGSVAVVWFYRSLARGDAPEGATGMAVAVSKGALHCGAGCALGDLIAETAAYLFPALLVPFGFPGLFREPMFAAWGLDFLIAFALGIVFQYFAIAPMRGLGLRDGLLAALKADALSLISWQIGMYGFMALARFWLFDRVFKAPLDAGEPSFWFMMQLAMGAGFATAFPTNWWLIRAGIKERM